MGLRSIRSARYIGFFLMALLLTSFLGVFETVGQQNYDLDVPLPNGAHIYISYINGEANWTENEKAIINGNLTQYIPIFWNEFWAINHTARVQMVRENSGATANGGIESDGHGGITAYYGTIHLSSWAPGVLKTLLHEWTHLFQFWIPNYMYGTFPYYEAVANAFADVLIFQELGNSSEYNVLGLDDGGQLITPLPYGTAHYSWSTIYNGYNLLRGWEELWSYDHLSLKKFNTAVASLPSGSSIQVRDLVKSLLASYPEYAYDGLSIEDWLNGYAFFNQVSDLPENQNMVLWQGAYSLMNPPSSGTWTIIKGQVYIMKNGIVSQVDLQSFDFAIRDAQTHQLLYSEANKNSDGGHDFVLWAPANLPFRNLLKVDIVIHLKSGNNLPFTAYLAARQNYVGNRVIFFVDDEGYAFGNGISNVGAINDGILRWTDGNYISAKVSQGNNSYTYEIPNIMAHQNIPMTLFAVSLNQSTTFIYPHRTIGNNKTLSLQVNVNPKISSGNITLYQSLDLSSWVRVASATPNYGQCDFDLPFNDTNSQYYKASWSGDGIIKPSNSSIYKIGNLTSLPTATPTVIPTPTPTPTPAPTATPTPPPIPPPPIHNPTPVPTATPTPTPIPPTPTPTPVPATPSPTPTPATPTPTPATPTPTPATPTPTPVPTASPTTNPTTQPTTTPTVQPTPTNTPPSQTPDPTATPTTQPTTNPTNNPTATTTLPTQEPTTNPTSKPSPTPVVPEFSTLTILLLFLTTIFPIILMYRKKNSKRGIVRIISPWE